MANTEIKELENKINNSSLFLIDKEKEKSLFNAERLKFLKLLYLYCGQIYREAQEYTEEIIECADEIIARYDTKRGDFLHFFNFLFNRRIGTSKYIDNDKLDLSDYQQRQIKILRYFQSKYPDLSDKQIEQKTAKQLSVSIDKVCELIHLSQINIISLNSAMDGTEQNGAAIMDAIPSLDEDILTSLMRAESQNNVLQLIDKVFKSQKTKTESQRKKVNLISSLLTAKVLESLEDCAGLEKFSFIDKNIVSRYKTNDIIPSDAEIAKCFDVLPQHISRLLKGFRLVLIREQKGLSDKSVKSA